MALAGRGFGKTRIVVEWARWMIETGRSRRMAVVGATAADVRDILIEGQSGFLNVCPPYNMPKYEPSKRRLTWKNGAIATCYSAEEPRRLRGPQHDAAICDELASWQCPETYDMLLLGLRLGDKPKMMIATTPKPTKLVKKIAADPRTHLVRGSTYENERHLAPAFFETVVASYEGTRLGRQEVHAEILEVSDAAWFARFDKEKHVSEDAEHNTAFPVHIAVDCGVSQTVGAVFFQIRQIDRLRHKITVYDEYMRKGSYSAENAASIRSRCDTGPSQGFYSDVVLDPASTAETGIGPAAIGAFEAVFRNLSLCQRHSVGDALDQMECLLDTGCLVIHPRCVHLIEAFQNYSRKERGGEFLDEPAENQSPHEDLMDALRYGIRNKFPEGRIVNQNFMRKQRGEIWS